MRVYLFALAILAGCGDSGVDKQILPIGSPCARSADCGTGKFFCDAGHPNGYCKSDCHTDVDCPSNAVCAGALTTAPGECHRKCTTATAATDCRTTEGYICKDMPDDASGPYCDVPEAS